VPTFNYKARHPDGHVVTGDQEAASEFDALRMLQQQGFLVTKIQQGTGAYAAVSNNKRQHQHISSQDIQLFIRQLATLLTSTVPLLRSLEVIRTQTQSRRLSVVIERVESDIRSGATLKDALSRHPKLFPILWSYLIEAGEVSGKLPLVLDQLANYFETSQRIKSKFITALAYPAVLIVVAIGAICVFMVWVIPLFARLFSSFNAPLPLLTQMVIAMSAFVRAYIVWIILAVTGAGMFMQRVFQSPGNRATLDRIALRLPILGAFVQDTTLARVSSSLHLLIKSGVNILRALEITAKSSGNRVFEDALMRVRDEVQHGRPIGVSMAKHAVFPGMLVQMVMIGEESGHLEELLGRVQVYYEEQVDVFVSRLSTLIEPLILGFMGGIVGLLVVSMLLPVLRLSTLGR